MLISRSTQHLATLDLLLFFLVQVTLLSNHQNAIRDLLLLAHNRQQSRLSRLNHIVLATFGTLRNDAKLSRINVQHLSPYPINPPLRHLHLMGELLREPLEHSHG